MNKEWAENRLADFNIWAAGVGASAKQKASPEERLAFEPQVRTAGCDIQQIRSDE